MKKILFLINLIAVSLLIGSCGRAVSEPSSEAFSRIEGHNLIAPDGSEFFIKGTNLGNWLNPEGCMFGFS